jgi:hypothetical protein
LFTKGSSAFLLLLLSLPLFAPAQQHNVLLPQPRQIAYGPGKLNLEGLQIVLPAHAAAEDQFAAERLSSCLGMRSGLKVGVESSPVAGPAISFIRTGGIDALPQPGEKAAPDSRESYSIAIGPHGGEIKARSSAGLFYAAQTVCQMVEADKTIPEARIEDWPAVAYRGVMVDMSEGPLPTVQEIERQIEFLSRWKINQYFFYSESSIELTGYELLNPDARVSKDQIRGIVAFARARHIDVIPCLELYGHLHDLFRIEKYSSLADFPHGGEFNPRDPGVMRLITDWASQFSELFPSPFVQIGFDETWQIQKAAQQQGKGTTAVDLFAEQLGNVSHVFEQHGKTVMAWADIMVKYPGIISKLPPGIIAVSWWYDPSPDPEYKRWLDPLIQNRVPHYVAPGVNSWDEIYPDYNLTFANIDTLLAAGRRSGASGVMNTIWTDDAQMLMSLSWPGMAYGAVAAWQPAQAANTNFFTDYSNQMYAPQVAREIASALEELNGSESHLQQAIGHDTMNRLWRNPFEPALLKRCAEHQADLRQSRILAEEAQDHLSAAAELSHHEDNFDDLMFAGRLLDYAGLKFLYGIEIAEQWRTLGLHPSAARLNEFVGETTSQQHGKAADLMDMITGLQPQYRQVWLAQYSSYRLGSALGRWDAEYQYWRQLQTRLQLFPSRYQAGGDLPALQSVIGSPN